MLAKVLIVILIRRFFCATVELKTLQGYARGSHRSKAWLLETARKVEARARAYQRQYASCEERLRGGGRWRWIVAAVVVLSALWGSRRLRRRR